MWVGPGVDGAVVFMVTEGNNINFVVMSHRTISTWLNAFSDVKSRPAAAEGYKRSHADPQIEVVPFRSRPHRPHLEPKLEKADPALLRRPCPQRANNVWPPVT
jgi:hypothetical protein